MKTKLYLICILMLVLFLPGSCIKTINKREIETGNKRLNGRYKVYDEKEALIEEGRFKAGKKTGKWMYYHNGYLWKTLLFTKTDTSVVSISNIKFR